VLPLHQLPVKLKVLVNVLVVVFVDGLGVLPPLLLNVCVKVVDVTSVGLVGLDGGVIDE
jgi:hypothetical protein